MSRPFTFDRVVRILFTIALVVAAIWLIKILKNVLLPFCVACLIAYMMEPLVQHNRRLLHLKGRVTAIFVTLFEAVFFLRGGLLSAGADDHGRDAPHGGYIERICFPPPAAR